MSDAATDRGDPAVRLVNLTPHVLTLMVGDAVVLQQPPSPSPTRVQEVRSSPQELAAEFGGFPLVDVSYADRISGLPQPEEGTLFVVSRVTASVAQDRHDLVFPLDEVRDPATGTIIGCRALGRFQRAPAAIRGMC